MSLFAKIMVVVNFFLAVAFLAAAGTLLGAAEDWKDKYTKADDNAKATIAAKDQQINKDIDTIKQKDSRFAESEKGRAAAEASGKTLQDNNVQLEQAVASLRADYSKLADAQKDLQGKLADQNKMIDSLRSELATSEAGRKDLDGKLSAASQRIAQLEQDNDTATKGLAAQQAENKGLADKNDEMATTLARYRQEKGPLSAGISMKSVKGVVQAASNKDDIYVISVGGKDGVTVGYEFTVYRGSEYVSTILIDRVTDQYATGRTKPGTKRKDVMAGDECSTQL